jgi:hypothetical protein
MLMILETPRKVLTTPFTLGDGNLNWNIFEGKHECNEVRESHQCLANISSPVKVQSEFGAAFLGPVAGDFLIFRGRGKLA